MQVKYSYVTIYGACVTETFRGEDAAQKAFRYCSTLQKFNIRPQIFRFMPAPGYDRENLSGKFTIVEITEQTLTADALGECE